MKHMRLVIALIVVAWGGTGVAHATTAMYVADATATLSITSISLTPVPANIFIINAPLPSVSAPIEDTTGNATVMTDGAASGIGDPDALLVGDGFFNSTSASGTAGLPAPSSSFAFSLASGQILIDNESSNATITVEFLLSYTLSASSVFSDPASEDVFAFSDVQLNWEPVSGTFDFFSDEADSDDRFGNPTMVTDTFAFSVTVLPGFVGNASLQTASSGYADTFVVPLPAAVWLFGSALGFFTVSLRRSVTASGAGVS
ncbi:MAG: hypothetical protein KJO55_08540 [Gammaproteobacteria bacterium]|nr:hypothetical protein [Gammaproteobacteria bacterium]